MLFLRKVARLLEQKVGKNQQSKVLNCKDKKADYTSLLICASLEVWHRTSVKRVYV